jgi:glycosyltransferase involved in cell wall biosynthesis
MPFLLFHYFVEFSAGFFMNPQISVIIPAYNRAHCIMRSIQSVLAQTLPVTEIIIVDDGSTDGTAELIHSLHGSPIRLLRHPTNLGAAAARNTGMSAVSADCTFIAWLDSDDEWMPDKIEMQISLFSQIPSLAAVCTAYTLIQGKSQYDYIPLDRKPWSEGLLFGCDLGPGATLLVRR